MAVTQSKLQLGDGTCLQLANRSTGKRWAKSDRPILELDTKKGMRRASLGGLGREPTGPYLPASWKCQAKTSSFLLGDEQQLGEPNEKSLNIKVG